MIRVLFWLAMAVCCAMQAFAFSAQNQTGYTIGALVVFGMCIVNLFAAAYRFLRGE